MSSPYIQEIGLLEGVRYPDFTLLDAFTIFFTVYSFESWIFAMFCLRLWWLDLNLLGGQKGRQPGPLLYNLF